MHILIAPNAFKNSLSASESAVAIQEGLLESGLHCTTQCFPIGDGGDGTAALLVDHFKGHFTRAQTTDPFGRNIHSTIGFTNDGKTAVIELADSSGLKLLESHELNPLHALSTGTGELIRTSLDQGARRIILCIGGSGTVDGGCGILQSLGVRFLDQFKEELNPLPANLIKLDSIDLSGIDTRIYESELTVLCDVNNFLLGEHGAVYVFGPQKGASPDDLVVLERAMVKFREVTRVQTGKDLNAIRHGGAAGGVAAGLSVFLNARLVQGIEYFLDTTGFDEALQRADLLITGEGSIDLQTLDGKGPFGVANRAKKKGIPVIGLAGCIAREGNSRLHNYFDVLLPIGRQSEDINNALQHTAINLQFTAREMGRMIALRPGLENMNPD